ncbi:hypothetical protein [Lutispora sp.]|uniref:hypothetical protein n=1 Tax=Lutispora sp. TaxID=2828727 RepID=UPI003569B1EE
MLKKKPSFFTVVTLTALIILSITVPVNSSWTADMEDQTITAYCSNGTACASGNMPYKGAVAVHPDEPDSDIPLFNFGAHITLTSSVPMYGGGTRTTFTVEDIGDQDYSSYNSGDLTLGWLDVWQGTGASGSAVWNWCNNTFETKIRDYHAYWP